MIDSTGVGSAVTGLFTDANFANPARFVEVVGGDVVSEEWPTCKVPKRELVSTAQVLLQTDRLKIARGLPHAALLLRELVNFRFRIELKSSRETPELWREGPSDDLVLALATALWFAERNSGIPGGMSVGRSEFCDGLL